MKEMVRFGLILTIICSISAGLLAAVNKVTEPTILEQRKAEEKKALEKLFPSGDEFREIEVAAKKIYLAFDAKKQPLGYAFKAQDRGYSSVIESFVAVDTNGKIIAVEILSQNETPGVGTRITEAQYLDRFKGVRLSVPVTVDTISGATISSSALIRSIEQDAAGISAAVQDCYKTNGR